MQINQPAPDFQLPDLRGKHHKLSDYHGKIVILNFWSAECPHSERTDRSLLKYLVKRDVDVKLLSIAANRNESLSMLEDVSKMRQIPEVLIDAEHVIADIYEAVTTPHVFVVDREGILRYCGAVDDVTFRHRQATCFFLEEVVDALLAGQLPEVQETIAYGCAIVREI